MNLTRRQFLSITASAGLLLVGGVGIASRNKPRLPEVFKETRLLMGSLANLTIISDDAQHAHTAITAAFDRMQALEDIFSRFREHSQLSQLNAAGFLADPDPSLVEVLSRAVTYGQLTDGAFDVTIEPVHKLYREHARKNTLPAVADVENALRHVDFQAIEITAGRVGFKRAGMAVTLDGIAKGYIIDQGAAVLRDFGFDNVLVELGGDMNALGHPATRPWQIEIQHPVGTQTQPQPLVAMLNSAALATSGDYMYSFTADHRLHHILDPKSGISPLELTSASVIASTACDADALATSLMVMGSQRGLALAKRLAGIEALLITKSGELHKTHGFPIDIV